MRKWLWDVRVLIESSRGPWTRRDCRRLCRGSRITWFRWYRNADQSVGDHDRVGMRAGLSRESRMGRDDLKAIVRGLLENFRDFLSCVLFFGCA